jgi:hypothetical protein
VPGQGCLVCRNRIDLARAHTELLTPGERKRRIDEGYAPALADVEPAVVTFTTAVASLAVSELLDRLLAPPRTQSEDWSTRRGKVLHKKD